MKRSVILATLVAVVLVFAVISSAAMGANGTPNDHPKPIPNPDPSADPAALTPNLSFPVLFTTPVFMETPLAADDEYIVDWQTFFQMEQALNPIYDADGNITGYEPAFTSSGEPVLTFSVDENGDYILTPIASTDYNFAVTYTGTYPTMGDFTKRVWTDCYEVQSTDPVSGEPLVDPITGLPIMEWVCEYTDYNYLAYLQTFAPWYVQTTDAEYNKKGVNIWQADYALYQQSEDPTCDDVVKVDFVDWGNPLENINPVVGLRFPVEMALYAKFDAESTMRAYKSACLEYMSSRDEFFGVTKDTWESHYATVLTTDFRAWVEAPGGVKYDITLEPAIGPSGKMNFASASGGWIPATPGWHRIYFRILDPAITLSGAIVNDDDHYCMACGTMCDALPQWKLDKTGIYYNDTWIDVYVDKPAGGKKQ